MSTVETQIEELRPQDLTSARTFGEWADVALAFGTLLAVDLAMKIAGFHRFHSIIRRCPVLGEPTTDQNVVRRICTAVDRAAAFYFKRAWCLQRSAAASCLLRLHSVPATFVIGVKKIPFYAHAWVEVKGEVVNDHPGVLMRYTVLERC